MTSAARGREQVLAVVEQEQHARGRAGARAAPRCSERPGSSRTSMAAATVASTRDASRSGARSTNHTPSGTVGQRARAASSSARRVLPLPPKPVSVSSRVFAISAPQRGQLGLAPDEAGEQLRQVVGVTPATSPSRSAAARRMPSTSSISTRMAWIESGRFAMFFSRRARQQGADARREAARQPVPRRLLLQRGAQHLADVRARERGHAGERLVQHGAEGEHVGARVLRAGDDLLGRHVAGGALGRVRAAGAAAADHRHRGQRRHRRAVGRLRQRVEVDVAAGLFHLLRGGARAAAHGRGRSRAP